MNKIKEEDLKKLRELIAVTNQGQLQIGQLENQKYAIINELQKIQQEFSNFQAELEKEYGKVSINVEDGTYTEIKEDESDKKN